MEKLLALLFMIHVADGTLPKSARRVESCPEANNITAWREASNRMNCSDYSSQFIKEKLLYHCLPSSFLNETIEFCASNAAITAGNCPIYNYQNGATVATSRSCANFTHDCPSPKDAPYHTLSFYKYFACWDINKESKCYHAEPNCPKNERRMSYQTTIPNELTIITDSSVNTATKMAKTPDYQSPAVPNTPVWAIVIAVVLALMVVSVPVIIVAIFCYRKHLHKRRRKGDNIDPGESEPLQDTKENTCRVYREDSFEHKEEIENEEQETKYKADEKHCREGDFQTGDNIDPGESEPLKDTKEKTKCRVYREDSFEHKEKTKYKADEKHCREGDFQTDNPEHNKKDDEEGKKWNTTDVKKTPEIQSSTGTRNTTVIVPEIQSITGTRNTTVIAPEIQSKTGTRNTKEIVPEIQSITGTRNTTVIEPLETNEAILEFNSFLYTIGEKLIMQNKFGHFEFLLNEHDNKNMPTEKMDLFLHWSKKYNFWYNIWHLQQLLRKCNAIELCDKCERFATRNLSRARMFYFSRIVKDNKREEILLHTSLNIEDARVREEMETIREKIATHLDKDLGDVHLDGIKCGSLIFIFSLPEFDVNRLLDSSFLKSMWRSNVLKIEMQNFILTPDANQRKSKTEKRIRNHSVRKMNGSCIHEKQRHLLVHLSKVHRPYSKRDMQVCTEMLVKWLEMNKGIRVNGDLAVVDINNKKKEDSLPLTRKKQTMADQDEIEPYKVLDDLKEAFPEHYDDCEKAVSAGNSRRERADNLLEYFNKTNGKRFNDIKNRIFTQRSNSGKEQNAHNNEILKRKEMMKEKIKKNWDFLLDEVDSHTIYETFESKKCDENWQKVCRNDEVTSRKDRIESFLHYVCENEEWLLPFDEVLCKQNLSMPCVLPCSTVYG